MKEDLTLKMHSGPFNYLAKMSVQHTMVHSFVHLHVKAPRASFMMAGTKILLREELTVF